MNSNIRSKTFNKRAFVSVGMITAGLFLPFSGIMNHHLQFDPLTTERHFWMTVHNVAAILFTVKIILHITYNRRVLGKYMKKSANLLMSKEAVMAIVLVLAVVGLFSLHVFHTG